MVSIFVGGFCDFVNAVGNVIMTWQKEMLYSIASKAAIQWSCHSSFWNFYLKEGTPTTHTADEHMAAQRKLVVCLGVYISQPGQPLASMRIYSLLAVGEEYSVVAADS